MKFQQFSKNLSSEIETIFANIGDCNIPDNTQKLDTKFSIEDMLEKARNLDLEENVSPENGKGREL